MGITPDSPTALGQSDLEGNGRGLQRGPPSEGTAWTGPLVGAQQILWSEPEGVGASSIELGRAV